METKQCPRCKESKPLSAFKNSNLVYTKRCRQCLDKEKTRRKNKYQIPVVYALIDPRNDQVFYVGCSRMPTVRLAQHIRDAHNPETTNQKKNKVIRDIQHCGANPLLIVLQETTQRNRDIDEKWWILHLTFEGATLTNFTPKNWWPK